MDWHAGRENFSLVILQGTVEPLVIKTIVMLPVPENNSDIFLLVAAISVMNFGISLSYYDKILAAIAASLGGGAIAGVITAVSFRVGLLSGALFATIFVYDAMFRNPPRPTPSPQAEAAAIVWHVFLGTLLVTTWL